MLVEIFREARYGVSKGSSEVASLPLGGDTEDAVSLGGLIWVYETKSGWKELWLV